MMVSPAHKHCVPPTRLLVHSQMSRKTWQGSAQMRQPVWMAKKLRLVPPACTSCGREAGEGPEGGRTGGASELRDSACQCLTYSTHNPQRQPCQPYRFYIKQRRSSSKAKEVQRQELTDTSSTSC